MQGHSLSPCWIGYEGWIGGVYWKEDGEASGKGCDSWSRSLMPREASRNKLEKRGKIPSVIKNLIKKSLMFFRRFWEKPSGMKIAY